MAYIPIQSDVVAKKANETINRIDTLREEEKQNLIDAEREYYKRWWFRRLFHMAIPTDEELIRSLKSKVFGPWTWACVAYGRQRETAERLLNASKCGGEMLLSDSDWEAIS